MTFEEKSYYMNYVYNKLSVTELYTDDYMIKFRETMYKGKYKSYDEATFNNITKMCNIKGHDIMTIKEFIRDKTINNILKDNI